MTEPIAHDGTSFGVVLRAWRQRRRFTQLDLSIAAGVSAKHLSFLETGRAKPSRDMVLGLAQHLAVPLRERNQLLVAAGFAPAYPARALDDPDMAVVRGALEQVLRGHQPYPAIVVDRSWNLVMANPAAALFLEAIDPALLGPPANVYRIGLHPDGLAPRVVNFADFAHDLLARLRHDVGASADPDLAALLREVEDYPTVRVLPRALPDARAVVVPIRLRHPRGELSFVTTVATFGTPVDVTVAELALETFFPANDHTVQVLHDLAADASAAS